MPASSASPSTPAASRSGGRPRSRFHINGLDALRAVAVLAVVLYHVRSSLLPGGFLGVDVFFVVSGFLITTLLLRERARTGRIDLKQFWVRRARRLLPALVLVVLVSTAFAALADPDLRVGIGRQVLGALTFSTNWVEIVHGSSYFDHTSPLLFMNFWSLAVEEQFYIVWPLLFLVILRCVPQAPRRVLLALAGAVCSAALMGFLHAPGQDATRVYYGTDTHSFGLLLGIALAFTWQGGSAIAGTRVSAGDAEGQTSSAPAFRGVPAVVSFCLGMALLILSLAVLTETSALTYRGGLVLASLGSLLLIASQLGPQPVLGRLLETKPLVWVGRRSYGIYLWHWPVLVIANSLIPLEPESSRWWGLQLLAVALTFLLAAFSERFVERPVRTEGFRVVGARVLRTLRRGLARPAASVPTLVSGALVLFLVVLAAVGVATAPRTSKVQQDIERNERLVAQSQEQAKKRAEENRRNPSATPSSSTAPSPGAAAFPSPRPDQITLIGDSMIAVSADGIAAKFPGALIDGVPNRKWDEAEALVDRHVKDGTMSRYAVIDFGTNGGIPDEAVVRRVIDRLGPDRAIVLVTIYGNSTFIDPANQLLKNIAGEHPNVVVADWNAVAAKHPEYLQSDATHPNIEGANVFAGVLSDAFGKLAGKAPTR